MEALQSLAGPRKLTQRISAEGEAAQLGIGKDESGHRDDEPVLEDTRHPDGNRPRPPDDEENGEIERQRTHGVGEKEEGVESEA